MSNSFRFAWVTSAFFNSTLPSTARTVIDESSTCRRPKHHFDASNISGTRACRNLVREYCWGIRAPGSSLEECPTHNSLNVHFNNRVGHTFFVTGGGGGRGQELIFLGTDVCIVLFTTFLTSCPTPAIGGVMLSSGAIEVHSLLHLSFRVVTRVHVDET